MISTEQFIRVCSDISTNEPMSAHTYYKIGGQAELFAVPKNTTELSAVLELCVKNSIPYFILGKGSNILVSDEGFKGCVIDMSSNFSDMKVENEFITAGAGCLLSSVARTAAENSLSGFEELAGIPGTVGGALVMNAGCYGKEISGIVRSVSLLDAGKIKNVPVEEIVFKYRNSSLKGQIVTGAVFSLTEGRKESIFNCMTGYAEMRRAKQPLNLPSCGSVFKRPEQGFAGQLIEECGLKGRKIGGAAVSELHSGFIVNTGNATASDVLSLIKLIKKTVYEKRGVTLEEEVIYLGFKDEELK